MLPALPTGRECTSGAVPSASTISNAAVFCPSMRYGLTELTSEMVGKSAVSLRASSRQSSKLPSIWMIFAPCMTACASLPIAILPCGISTAQVIPARAAYAAADADVLPVDAHSTACWPRATASVTAIVMPRSLNEPVGLSPSTLRCTVQPVYSDNRGADTSGVPPSSRVIAVQSSSTGSRSR